MIFDPILAEILIKSKKIFQPGIWLPVTGGDEISSGFLAPMKDIDRLEAKIRISSGSSDKASFTLLMRVLGHKQRWRIYALDWNPTTPHSNPIVKGSHLSGLIIRPGQSHEHHFMNRANDENPDGLASPIAVDLPDYNSALDLFCDRVNVTRPPHLPEPTAQGRLL